MIKVLTALYFCFFLCLFPVVTFAEEDPELTDRYLLNNSTSAPKMNSLVETIDPRSGHLKIVQTDIDLPGAGGLDLKLMRVYNSNIWGRRDMLTYGSGSIIKYSSVLTQMGHGWSMHMGIMRNPYGEGSYSYPHGTGVKQDNPVLEMPDGSQQVFYSTNDNDVFISTQNWIFKRISGYPAKWEMVTSSGMVYTFVYSRPLIAGYEAGGVKVAQVTKIENPARSLAIEITYEISAYIAGCLLKQIKQPVRDFLGHITYRTIEFNYEKVTPGRTNQKLTFVKVNHPLRYNPTDQRTSIYEYIYDLEYIACFNMPYYYLTEVRRPSGNPWKYDYESSIKNYTCSTMDTTGGQLTSFEYPQGGKIQYEYDDVLFNAGTTDVGFRVVKQKTTSGPGIKPGTWVYSYDANKAVETTTTITATGDSEPYKEIHKFHGWGSKYWNGTYIDGSVWKVGLPISKEIYLGSTLQQKETYDWEKSDLPISDDVVANTYWQPFPYEQLEQKYIRDEGIYRPQLHSKTIERDGQTYVTTYDEYDNYGNPKKFIESSGVNNRTTTLTYWKNEALNIVRDKPKTETVSGSFEKTFTTEYDYFDSGYLRWVERNKSEGQSGVKTTYDYYEIYSSSPPTGRKRTGEIKKVTDPNQHTKTYKWALGHPETIENGIYTVSNVTIDSVNK